jgi:hydrogenase nickel incorporation protein HypA/HybF
VHEVALAQSVWREVEAQMSRRTGDRLAALNLVAGRWSGADPESLEFALGLLAADSPWPDARIHIRTEPLALKCRACGREFEPGDFDLACSGCGSSDVEVTQGRDLRLESIEVEPDHGEADPS